MIATSKPEMSKPETPKPETPKPELSPEGRARRLSTAVLISGGGSNMQALVRASMSEDYPARIDLIICNRPNAAGIARAQTLGVACIVIDHKAFDTREAFERELDAALRDANIELIACAGFMRVLTGSFVSRWNGRIVNIHPSLLPKYKGLHTHRRALEAGETEHGASVHWVTQALDAGGVIAQTRVSISDGETHLTLAAKVLAQEHGLYVRGLALAAESLLNV